MASLNPALSTHLTIFVDIATARSDARDLAWTKFHDRYAPIIRGFARKMGTPSSQLDDLVQDVMLGFYSISPRFTYDRSKGRFRGFLKKCVRSAMIKLGRRTRLGQEDEHQFNPEDKKAEEIWVKIWDKELLQRAIEEAREHCSPQNYRIFQHYVINKQPPERVAAELGVSMDQVYQAKARLKVVISGLLDRLEEEYG